MWYSTVLTETPVWFEEADVKEVRHISTEIPSGRKAMAKVPEGIDHLKWLKSMRLSQKTSCSSYC